MQAVYLGNVHACLVVEAEAKMLKKFATEAAKRMNARRRRLLRRSIRVAGAEYGRTDLSGDSEERKRETASKSIQGIARLMEKRPSVAHLRLIVSLTFFLQTLRYKKLMLFHKILQVI